MTAPAAPVAIVGGTALAELTDLADARDITAATRYGPPSGPLRHGSLGGREVVFLYRHGPGHRLPPHAIDYRANIRALADAGAKTVIAAAAVGGITEPMRPGRLVLPDQIIDYTWGRAHSFCDGRDEDQRGELQHVDFAEPYDTATRTALLDAAHALGHDPAPRAVHGITQGPRLETAAEIQRMRQDGCDIVGMTGMPEAALAREAGLAYACIAVVVNRAAGTGDGGPIHAEIEQYLAAGMTAIGEVIKETIRKN